MESAITVPVWVLGLAVTAASGLLSAVGWLVARIFDHDKRLALGSQMFQQLRDELARKDRVEETLALLLAEMKALHQLVAAEDRE